ncbi:MAG: alpha/beta hydrolase [Halanaerobiales bacterium]|nr:alpha/beta hydrolase [Halanaerobiales bacterium]
MPKEEINGVEIYYELSGKGKDNIAFLNGIAMQTALWEAQEKHFQDNYQVLLHDFRGQGQSSLKPNNFTFKQHADDFNKLLEELDIDKIHVVGVSYGAEVAMQFALQYPKKVSSLVLGTAVSEIKPLLKAKIESWIMAAETYNGELFFKVMAPYVYSNSFYEENGEWLENRAVQFGRIVNKEWLEAFISLSKNFLTLDITNKLSNIKVPTLVISGEEDILKPPYYGKIIKNEIPNSKFKIIDNAAHGLFAEKPMEFNQLVGEFIKNNV